MTMNSIWSDFQLFMSATYVQDRLKRLYLKNRNDPQKSYENTYRFLYFIEQGMTYYKQGMKSPISIQPTLLFYGFIHLIKACILLLDPNYPETTSVLAHGVSTRKRKKQNYSFLQDEIKTQKNGLFPHMCLNLFHTKQVDGEKWLMADLLKEIPEVAEFFPPLLNEQPRIFLNHSENSVVIPESALDQYHLSNQGFLQFIQSIAIESNITKEDHCEEGIPFVFNKPLFNGKNERLPFRLHLEKKEYSIRSERTPLQAFPELLIHYLLLYNLSMIARYETEWWYELLKTTPNEEYPLITNFLNITAVKGPVLLWNFISEKMEGID